MSSQSKRRAESEEVAHKKKPRKGEEEKDDFNQDDDGLDVGDDDVGALDKGNTIPTDRRTRGKPVDYTKVLGLGDDNGFAGEEVSKEKNGAPAGPRTRSPQREPVVEIGEDEEDDDDEEDGEDGEDEDDGSTDEYEEDEEE